MKTKRILLSVGVVGAMVLSACTSVDSPTNTPNQRAQEGTAIGAIAGALLGARAGQSPNAKRNAAIVGGIVGGVAGNAIGARLDAQAADLQSNISDGRIQIVNTGSELVVTMPQDILFGFDSDVVSSGLRGDLAALAGNLQRFPDSDVVITGHTDNIGDAAYNQDLSQRRASAVTNILISNGVSSSRLVPVGAGESRPVATNLTDAGRAQNRRVEIVIRPRA